MLKNDDHISILCTVPVSGIPDIEGRESSVATNIFSCQNRTAQLREKRVPEFCRDRMRDGSLEGGGGRSAEPCFWAKIRLLPSAQYEGWARGALGRKTRFGFKNVPMLCVAEGKKAMVSRMLLNTE